MIDLKPRLEFNLDFFCPDFLSGSGCYAVFDGEVCLYVGMATNLKRRIAGHFKADEYINLFRCHGNSYLNSPAAPPDSTVKIWFGEDICQMERDLIRELKPLHNIQQNRNKK